MSTVPLPAPNQEEQELTQYAVDIIRVDPDYPLSSTTYFHPYSNNRINEHEQCTKSKNLWVIAIIDEWQNFHGRDTASTHAPEPYLKQKAKNWFTSDEYYWGSFSHICEELGLGDIKTKMVERMLSTPPSYDRVMELRRSILGD